MFPNCESVDYMIFFNLSNENNNYSKKLQTRIKLNCDIHGEEGHEVTGSSL